MKIYYFKNKLFPKARSGSDFDKDIHFHHDRGLAFEIQGAYLASGINHGGEIHYRNTSVGNVVDIKEWISKSFGDAEPEEGYFEPGNYYKRISRPFACGGIFTDDRYEDKIEESLVAVKILLKKLEDLFETVEPTEENLSVHGHKIREIILLACMEVESSWTAVLKENNYPHKPTPLNTNDYVKLLEPMLLDGYKLSLQSYKSFPAITPFKGWNSKSPTISLPWYDAYNKVKHDREENLKLATLENAVYAVGAAVVMLKAQFGMRLSVFHGQKDSFIRSIFKIATEDMEKYERTFYISKFELSNDSGKPTPLVQDWKLVDYFQS